MTDSIANPLVKEPKLKYPYDSNDRHQVVYDVSRADHGYIKCLRPTQGTLKIVGAILWKRLCDSLRERGLIDYINDQDKFEEFMNDIVILPRHEYNELLKKAVIKKGKQPIAPVV